MNDSPLDHHLACKHVSAVSCCQCHLSLVLALVIMAVLPRVLLGSGQWGSRNKVFIFLNWCSGW